MDVTLATSAAVAVCLSFAVGVFIGSLCRVRVPLLLPDAGLIDATLHEDVLEILTAALKTPGLSYIRPKILHVLGESGYEVRSDCRSGKCVPRLIRKDPSFIQK